MGLYMTYKVYIKLYKITGLVIPWQINLNLRHSVDLTRNLYEGWNFNSGKYLFTTDTK